MRVAVYYSNSDLRIEERPRPRPDRGELLLRVQASGICGSDLMEWYRAPKAPLVLGHEVAGVVEAAGDDVVDFQVGDRIVATHHVPCGECRLCRTDRHAVCPMLHATTFEPGGFSEFVRLPAVNVAHGTLRLPDSVSFDEGSFVEPLACVIRGQRFAGVQPGDAVAVLGTGISGILHVQLARAIGARHVIATDTSPERLDLARRFGAHVVLRADDDTLEQRVRECDGGRLPDRVLVCAASKSAMEQALRIAGPGGSVLFFAPLPPGETLSFPVGDLWKQGLSIVQSYSGPPHDMRAALDLIAARRVDVASMVTHRLPLDEIARGFRLVAAGGSTLKVVIDPWL